VRIGHRRRQRLGADDRPAASSPLTVEETEGPYYFDADKIRSDIREDRKGTRLALALRVRDAGTCEPISDAVVDIWHCDAAGGYSGFDGGGGAGTGPTRPGGGPGGAGGGTAQTDTRYLRGQQVTNAEGIVRFTTIYPGWYQGRTVHIHAKVHLNRQTVLTTQLLFDDDVSAKVFQAAAYSGRGARDQFNDTDGIFDEALLVTLSSEQDGYRAVMTFDVEQA